MQSFGDVAVEAHGHVALLEIQRPPNNFFDVNLINALGDAFEAMDNDDEKVQKISKLDNFHHRYAT